MKIRGMRVELGEIEAGVVKAASGLLSNCAVKLRDSFLVAYCQAEPYTLFRLVQPCNHVNCVQPQQFFV